MRALFWISTVLLSLIMFGSAGMYLVNHADVSAEFVKLGYPSYLVIPLAIAKSLGALAILVRWSRTLTEWAYAGLFFDFVLALVAHLAVGDGDADGAIVALALLAVSYTARAILHRRATSAA